MTNDVSESRSVSLKTSLWEKVEAAAESDGKDRSKYVANLIIADLSKRGMLSASSEIKEIYEMVREALAIGVPVKQIVEDAIRKGAC